MRKKDNAYFAVAGRLGVVFLAVFLTQGCPPTSEGEGEGEGEECSPDNSIVPEYYYEYIDDNGSPPFATVRVEMNLDTYKIAVRFEPNLPTETRQEIYEFVAILRPYDERCIECIIFERDEQRGQTVGFTRPCTTAAQVLGAIETLNHLPGVQFATPVFTWTDAVSQYVSEGYLLDTFYVSVYDTMPDDSVRNFGDQFGVEVAEVFDYTPIHRRGYRLRIGSWTPMNTLELCNVYWQQEWTDGAQPDFGCITGCMGPASP